MKLRILIIILLVLSFLGLLIRGKANKFNKIKKIIIFQGSKLGDMVCTTPIFRAVKEKYPGVKLIVVGNKINQKVLEYNVDVDEYIAHDDRELFKTLWRIKKEKADVACITSPIFIHLALLYLSGVSLVVAPRIENGWCPWQTKSYRLLLKFVETRPHYMGQYAPREYLRLLEPIGIYTEETRKYLGFSSGAKEYVDKLLKESNIGERDFLVGISLTAGNKIKHWPEEKFAEIADYLVEKKRAKLAIIGGPNDQEETAKFLNLVKNKETILDTTKKLNIDQLKAFVSRLGLFIAVDTGPIYIAEAFDIPTVDIVGPMDENEQPPTGKIHKVVVPKRDKPQLHIMNARMYDEVEARRQVESITPQDVIVEIENLI